MEKIAVITDLSNETLFSIAESFYDIVIKLANEDLENPVNAAPQDVNDIKVTATEFLDVFVKPVIEELQRRGIEDGFDERVPTGVQEAAARSIDVLLDALETLANRVPSTEVDDLDKAAEVNEYYEAFESLASFIADVKVQYEATGVRPDVPEDVLFILQHKVTPFQARMKQDPDLLRLVEAHPRFAALNAMVADLADFTMRMMMAELIKDIFEGDPSDLNVVKDVGQMPELLFEIVDGEAVEVNGHEMIAKIETGRIFLEAPKPGDDEDYPWVHVRATDNRALFTISELIDLLHSGKYSIS